MLFNTFNLTFIFSYVKKNKNQMLVFPLYRAKACLGPISYVYRYMLRVLRYANLFDKTPKICYHYMLLVFWDICAKIRQ
jgi:hypothetical protein